MSSIRVMITDDHLIVRQGLSLILETADGIEVVGEAADGVACLQLAAELQPDVILMDLRMPRLDGISAIEQLRHEYPAIAIVILTTYNEDELMLRGLRAGARGYLLKDAKLADLIRAVTAVSEGNAIFSPAIARRMVHFFNPSRTASQPVLFPELTEREREILTLIAQGWSNEAIATRLVLSLKTVRNHVSNILSKLQVNDRASAIVKARDAGIG